MRNLAVRVGLAAAVTAAATAGVGVPSAAASTSFGLTTTITFSCTEPPWPGEKDQTFDVTLDAPPVVLAGGTIAVQASMVSAAPSVGDLPANALNGYLDVVVGGAGSGEVPAKGLTNPQAVPTGQPVSLSGGVADVPAAKTGVYTFKPDDFQLSTPSNTTIVCVPKSGTSVSALTVVVK
jgi:hypothetical protein